MKTSAGGWLDHREAITVLLPTNLQETLRIQSKAEKRLRRAGEPVTGSFTPQEVPRDDSHE